MGSDNRCVAVLIEHRLRLGDLVRIRRRKGGVVVKLQRDRADKLCVRVVLVIAEAVLFLGVLRGPDHNIKTGPDRQLLISVARALLHMQCDGRKIRAIHRQMSGRRAAGLLQHLAEGTNPRQAVQAVRQRRNCTRVLAVVHVDHICERRHLTLHHEIHLILQRKGTRVADFHRRDGGVARFPLIVVKQRRAACINIAAFSLFRRWIEFF